ncbi:hypothetical protein [Catellatospora sichuanensis]|uniref:hypothetical protein n=1 Tax=Catellatospora sichuanensis TaxID=1969805 RepID=UPI001642D9D4|nr:hypothetical protein [Catellatospora sichuanensis]
MAVIAGRWTSLFCVWLSWSRFRAVLLVWGQSLSTLVVCLDATLRRIGGSGCVTACPACVRGGASWRSVIRMPSLNDCAVRAAMHGTEEAGRGSDLSMLRVPRTGGNWFSDMPILRRLFGLVIRWEIERAFGGPGRLLRHRAAEKQCRLPDSVALIARIMLHRLSRCVRSTGDRRLAEIVRADGGS